MHVHHGHAPGSGAESEGGTLAGSKRSSMSLDHVGSIDYMYYATGVVAIFQLLQVSFFVFLFPPESIME